MRVYALQVQIRRQAILFSLSYIQLLQGILIIY